MRRTFGRSMLAGALVVACLTHGAGTAGAAGHGDKAPSRGEKAASHGEPAATHDTPVNINTADVKELMTLEGIGHKVAEKIVQYRDSHGQFKKPEELRKVDGVGGGLWERNRARIVVK